MAVRLSRRKIASYCADQLIAGKQDITSQLAAYLVDQRRVRELELIVRDIEAALMERGVLVADVASAYDLTAETTKQIMAFVAQAKNGASVQLRTHIDPELLGGVKISLPGEELDATIRRKLTVLKASKV